MADKIEKSTLTSWYSTLSTEYTTGGSSLTTPTLPNVGDKANASTIDTLMNNVDGLKNNDYYRAVIDWTTWNAVGQPASTNQITDALRSSISTMLTGTTNRSLRYVSNGKCSKTKVTTGFGRCTFSVSGDGQATFGTTFNSTFSTYGQFSGFGRSSGNGRGSSDTFNLGNSESYSNSTRSNSTCTNTLNSRSGNMVDGQSGNGRSSGFGRSSCSATWRGFGASTSFSTTSNSTRSNSTYGRGFSRTMGNSRVSGFSTNTYRNTDSTTSFSTYRNDYSVASTGTFTNSKITQS